MSELLDQRTCAHCGATQDRSREKCWLCGSEVPPHDSLVDSAVSKKLSPSDYSFSLSTLLLIMTLAAVCFGLLAAAPGLAVPLCVLLVPVLVRTVMVVRRRKERGIAVSRSEKLGLMLSSFGVATVLATVVSVAAFGGFCGVCLMLVSTDNTYGGGVAMAALGLGFCAVSALGVWLTVLVVKWIRRRYRRDTHA